MNTFADNIQSNIYHLHKSEKRRDLPLFLAEQEWKTNHRYSDKKIMDKMKKYISMSTPITFKQITNSVLAYEKQFLLLNVRKVVFYFIFFKLKNRLIDNIISPTAAAIETPYISYKYPNKISDIIIAIHPIINDLL